MLVLAVPQKRIAVNDDGYGQVKTSKDFRQGFYLPISDVLGLFVFAGLFELETNN